MKITELQLRRRVDILIVRTVPCGQDSRVSKFLFHYRKNDTRVGLVCISRSNKCSRESNSDVPHFSIRGLDLNSLPFPINLVPGVWKFHRVLLFLDYLLTSSKLKFLWRPRALHGCDLDGYLISKLSFPLKKRRIFEVLDPWSTMTSSKRIARLENKAFYDAKVLVMPAFDSRIKITRDKATSFSNFMDIELAEELVSEAERDTQFIEYVESMKPFILTGGIMGLDTRIEELISAISKQDRMNLVATTSPDFIKGSGYLKIPGNVFCIGKQSWGRWLYLLKNCEAIWIYYSMSNNHFASHISPNKYWEAVLFNKTMLVNQISQFSDRTDLEGPYFEIGADPFRNLSGVIENLRDTNLNQPASLERVSKFRSIQDERTAAARLVTNWVFE